MTKPTDRDRCFPLVRRYQFDGETTFTASDLDETEAGDWWPPGVGAIQFEVVSVAGSGVEILNQNESE